MIRLLVLRDDDVFHSKSKLSRHTTYSIIMLPFWGYPKTNVKAASLSVCPNYGYVFNGNFEDNLAQYEFFCIYPKEF